MYNQRQVSKSLSTTLVLVRAAGWVLLALSVILFLAAGKSGPRIVVTAFYVAISMQGIATLLLVCLGICFRGPVGREVWRQCSPFVLGAIMWGVFFAWLWWMQLR